MKYVYSLFILLLALFLAVFIQQNSGGIQLKYIYWITPDLPLSLYMILAFAAGYLLAVLVGFTSGLRHRIRATSAEREVRQLRTEVEQLKKDGLEELKRSSQVTPVEPSQAVGEDIGTEGGASAAMGRSQREDCRQ